MLDRLDTLSGTWRWGRYENLALAMIAQAAADLGTKSACFSAAEWLLSEDFEEIAMCLRLDPRALRYKIFRRQFFEKGEVTRMAQTFKLIRRKDLSGVSGTGLVAEGVVFKNGKAVLCWTRPPYAVSVFDSTGEMMSVHGHGGSTELVWDEPRAVSARVIRRNCEAWSEQGVL